MDDSETMKQLADIERAAAGRMSETAANPLFEKYEDDLRNLIQAGSTAGFDPMASAFRGPTFMTGFALTADSSGTFATSTQVTGNVYAADYTPPTLASMTTAVSDMETAYADAKSRPSIDGAKVNLSGSSGIDGLTLTPGAYTWTVNLKFDTDITLADGPYDVFILQTTQDIVIGTSVSVILAGGAVAENVFGQTAGFVQIGAGSHMEGILLAKTEVTFVTGSSLNGRILAQANAALQMATITAPDAARVILPLYTPTYMPTLYMPTRKPSRKPTTNRN